jgi:2-keto-3-deoxy-L-rhamnonate aldolase RhmA
VRSSAPGARARGGAAVAGFDFVTFDAEHEPLGDDQLVQLIRAPEAFDIT